MRKLIERIGSIPLLIIDVQNGFVNNNSQHVLEPVLSLAKHWKAQGAPIYMTQFVNTEDSQWERLIGWSRLKDEHEIALSPQLDELSDKATVYRKNTYTAVVGPFLDDLQQERWPAVVVCGIATDSCVLATAIDLFEFSDSLRPIVVSDACASQAGTEAHDAGLFLLGRLIGTNQLVTTASVLGADAESDGTHDGPLAIASPVSD